MIPDEICLAEAIDLARTHSANGQSGPFGAVVADTAKGCIIGRGWNRVVLGHDPTAHAEVTAIRAACETRGSHDLSGCTLYSSCEPCPMCLAAIYWARLDRVVYAADRSDATAAGFDDERLYREVVCPPQDRDIPFDRALVKEGRSVLDAWRNNPDRIPY